MKSAWITLMASFVILAVYRTVSSTFSILVLPLEEELATSRAMVTIIFTAHMFVYSMMSLVCGVAINRFGPRATITAGGLLLAVGFSAMSVGHTVGTLTLAFGVLCGAGVALIGLPANFFILSERFPNRVATAMGIAGAGMGVGVLLLIPAIQYGAEALGWRTAFLLFGVAAALVVALCTSIQTVGGDQRVNPSSRSLGRSDNTEQGDGSLLAGPSNRERIFEILRSTKWREFAGANFLMGAALFGVLTHQVALLRESAWSAMAAATALGTVNILRSAGGPLWGVVLDRFGRRLAYALSTALAVAGIACIMVAPSVAAAGNMFAYVFIAAFGIGSAGTLPTVASLAQELYSRDQRAIAWGLTETAYAGGAAFGSWVVGWLFDINGGYMSGLMLVALLYMGSYMLVLSLSRNRPAQRASAAVR